MLLAKLKIVTMALLVGLLEGSGVGLHTLDLRAAEPTAPGQATQPSQKNAPKEGDLPIADAKAMDADKAKDAIKAKTQAMIKLQGKWKVQTIDIDGTQLPKQFTNAPNWDIADGKITIGDGKEGKFTIDPNQDPAHIDLEVASIDLGMFKFGDIEGTVKGIYKFDGDVLTICVVREDEKRPTKFLSGKTVAGFEGAFALVTFERVKKDK